MKLFKIFSILVVVVSFGCTNNTTSTKPFNTIYKALKQDFAPDKRVALFDIKLEKQGSKTLLTGETTTPKALQQLLDSLAAKQITVINRVRVLPDSAVGDKMYAIARNSVINIRSAPKHSAELGTQGLLGMPLKVLDKKGDFYRVQTPDNYISWVDKGGITRVNNSKFKAWQNAEKIIYTSVFGYVYQTNSDRSKIISDITLGGVLELVTEDTNFYKVKYPDNRIGFVKKTDAKRYTNWLNNLEPSAENIENYAIKMSGFPYLWGGTSSKGVDCSGFTKMVYLMNGFIIPRDASQQIEAGKTVDKQLNFKGLQKGDLLFFGKKATSTKKQRVTHVGIWLGNSKQEFIHASGNVHLSSIDKNEPNYDAFNKNRYLGSKRYLGVNDKLIVALKAQVLEAH